MPPALDTTDWASKVIEVAFRDLFGRLPTFYELQFALAHSRYETSWGRGWRAPCDTSFNWGAIHSLTSEGCLYTDSGPNGRYPQKFVVYDDDVDGARGYLKNAYQYREGVLAAAGRGDFDAAVRELYRTSYFQGTQCAEKNAAGRCVKPDAEANIASYRADLAPTLTVLDRQLQELGYPKPPPSLAAAAAPVLPVLLGLSAGALGVYVYRLVRKL